MITLTLVAPLLAALLLPAFDKVLLKDGRTIEGIIVKGDDPQVTKLKIGLVEVPIHNDLVDKTYVENLEGYVPKNKTEEENLKKGFVLFEGAWMSRTRREDMLKKRADADKAVIADLIKKQKWKNAVQEETRHFIVTSNCTEQVRSEYRDRLEAYYKYFTDDWGITLSPGEVRGKMKFFLYRDRDDFLRETGVPSNWGGFFSFVTGELQLYDDTQDPEETRDTLFHEGNHLLTYLIDTRFRYPTWLNEGMAEYYGTTEIDAKGQFHVGGLQYGRIVSLRNDRANSKVLRLREDVLLAEQSDYQAQQYAYGWSFVHFLMQSPKYGKTFRGFFANLPKNQDVECEEDLSFSNKRTAVRVPKLPSVAAALEKRLGKSIEELEQEWQAYTDETYGELPAIAWLKAASLALGNPRKDGSHIKEAMDDLDKACTMGVEVAYAYRAYAEFLRKGGMVEASDANIVQPPDLPKAWAMIQKAIQLDPIDPYNYAEAGGVLIMDGPVQDLDRAKSMCDTATALATKGDWALKRLVDELMSLIEPVREQRRLAMEAELEAAKNDQRMWHVAFWYQEPNPPPDNLTDLSTEALRDLIRTGKVGAEDNVWQAWREEDPDSGELVDGTNAWDKGWVKLKDCPVFAEDLAAAPAAPAGDTPSAPTAPAGAGSAAGDGGAGGGG